MRTGYTLHSGEFTIGIGSIGFGLTDNVQLGTNILLYLLQISNGNFKVNVIKSSTTAFALGTDFRHFNLDVFDNESSFSTISPYAVMSHKIGNNTLLHLAGRVSFFSGDDEIDDADAESSSIGTSILGGIEHSYSYKTKFLADVSYDITFDGLRIGGSFLWGWESFRLKLRCQLF